MFSRLVFARELDQWCCCDFVSFVLFVTRVPRTFSLDQFLHTKLHLGCCSDFLSFVFAFDMSSSFFLSGRKSFEGVGATQVAACLAGGAKENTYSQFQTDSKRLCRQRDLQGFDVVAMVKKLATKCTHGSTFLSSDFEPLSACNSKHFGGDCKSARVSGAHLLVSEGRVVVPCCVSWSLEKGSFCGGRRRGRRCRRRHRATATL